MLKDIKPRTHTKSTYEVPDPDYPGTMMEIERWHHEPGEGRCTCGRTVVLYGFTNTCECGRDYNMSGAELADRSQWGAETGENVADILQADSAFDSSDDGAY